MSIRVLVLTRYGQLGASSRVRFFQYLPYLRSQGLELQVETLLDDEYIRRLYSGRQASPAAIGQAYFRRLGWLARSRSFDLLWVEKELLPWLPAWAEGLLDGLGLPYVVDYDDAVFHRYGLHANPLVRTLLGRKIEAVMRHAAVVVAGNDYLAQHARSAGARRVEYLPTVVDLQRYTVQPQPRPGFRLGWIGTPVTAPNLAQLQPAFADARVRSVVRLVLIGAGGPDPLPGVEKEILPWSEAGEVADIQSFGAGIMPLPDEPFERGKCGYKLIQYMACGLPVIASPVGVNTRIVEPGATGLLASSGSEWTAAILELASNPGLRARLGAAGRARVEQEYSLQVAAPRLLEILRSASTLSGRP